MEAAPNVSPIHAGTSGWHFWQTHLFVRTFDPGDQVPTVESVQIMRSEDTAKADLVRNVAP